MIGANLPDIDVLAYFDGPAADLALRRGWTHGIPATVVLPFLLTGAVVLFDRAVRGLGRATLPSTVVPRQILLLAGVSVLTHPILDTLNTYGVRWLMPFSARWFYGDTLFIVDPWLWIFLGVGVALSGARQRSGRLGQRASRPASVALGLTVGYIIMMAVTGWMARRIATRELTALTGEKIESLMVGPAPLTPMVRSVVAAQGEVYRTAEFRWLGRPHLDSATIRSWPRGMPVDPPAARAADTELGRRFLSWARFPVFELEPAPDGGTLVHLIDLRYARRPAGFGAVTILVPSTGPPIEGGPRPVNRWPPRSSVLRALALRWSGSAPNSRFGSSQRGRGCGSEPSFA